jgi:uncharacterized coiled-coil protein SlyX
MNDEILQNLEIMLAHHERQLNDLSEMMNDQWKQIEALKRQLSQAEGKLKALESGAAESAQEGMMSITEIAARDKPPHY